MKQKHLLCLVIVFFPLILLNSCSPANTTDPDNITKRAPQTLQNGIQKVSGIVLSGGDTTPAGLLDAPRTFVYQVKLDGGEEINVTYTAYPPSPVSETQPKIRLAFYAGEINVGDYIIAHGNYDKSTQTLTVAAEGDYIETYSKKP
ncbi:MAG: hypothetical protein BGO78_02205 [Chloroflexi bacterium 44-23]|nr:MAG: hypothetical protein BGO78_02205 [Chloroflexi bacterium 44-23]